MHCSFLLRSHVSEACFLLLRGSDSFSAEVALEGSVGPFLNAESAKAAFARVGQLGFRCYLLSCISRGNWPYGFLATIQGEVFSLAPAKHPTSGAPLSSLRAFEKPQL